MRKQEEDEEAEGYEAASSSISAHACAPLPTSLGDSVTGCPPPSCSFLRFFSFVPPPPPAVSTPSIGDQAAGGYGGGDLWRGEASQHCWRWSPQRREGTGAAVMRGGSL